MLRILEILIEGFFLYLLYKLIFNFIIPVYRSAKKVRQQMRDMQGRMNEDMRGHQQNFSANQQHCQHRQAPEERAQPRRNKTSEEGEYIDYEEVK